MKTIHTRLNLNPGVLLKRFDRLYSRLVLPWIGITLFMYFLVHSPARDWIASTFGMASRGCFFCTYPWNMADLIQSFSALFLIGTSLLGAWATADHLDGPVFDRLIAFGVSFFALAIVPAAFIGLAAYFARQSFLRPPVGPILSSLPALLIVIVWMRQGWRPRRPLLSLEKPGPLTILISCLAAVLLLSITAISLAHPPTGYDALGYHGPLSVFLWQQGNLGTFLDINRNTWALAQPGAVEIWIGLLRIVGGQALANLGQLPFALLGSIAVYAFTRRLNLNQDAAILAGSSFMLMPMIVMQSGMQLNDLAGAALLISAVALTSRPQQNWNKRWLALVSVCMALAITTKLVLIPGTVVIGLFILAMLFRRARRYAAYRSVWSWIAIMAVSFLIVVAPWWLRNLVHYGNPVYPQALPLIGRGFYYATFEKADLAFVPRKAAWLIYPLIEQHEDQSGLGALFALTCLPGFVMAFRRGQRQPVILFTTLTVGVLLAWWLLSEHFPRFLLAPAGLCMAFVPWALHSVPLEQRRLAKVLVGAAAIFSVLVTFYQGLAPLATQPIQTSEFYNQVWGIDPVVQALPENKSLLWETGYAPDLPEYAAYLPLLGPSGGRLVLTSYKDTNAVDLRQYMKDNGIEYVYAPSSPQDLAAVERLFDPQIFELISQSKVVKGDLISPRRALFRAPAANEESQAVTRYLFKLK